MPKSLRHLWSYILMLAVVDAKLVKEMGGMKWVISGINKDGVLVEKNCLMQELKRLRTVGLPIRLMDPAGN